VNQYPKGFNLRKSNGKMKKFREGFMKIPKFIQFVDKVFDEVTNHPEWETISIYCEMGRHRSASAAEIVARKLRLVGRRSHVKHLCI
jgi:predicted protein tyrosine phosphatase